MRSDYEVKPKIPRSNGRLSYRVTSNRCGTFQARMVASLLRSVVFVILVCFSCGLVTPISKSYVSVARQRVLNTAESRHSAATYRFATKGGGKDDKATRQLLGVRGASVSKDLWAIRLQLCKPVTWIPLIWGVACGAAASGNFHTWNPLASDGPSTQLVIEDALKAFACMVLSGPILTGYTQTLNDWEDRDIDAINEPNRPIPSGAITEGQVKAQIAGLLTAGLALSYGLDKWAGHANPTIFELTIFGSLISYIYSAPPLKLKATGWAGSFALGSSYISLPWLCGQAMFGELSWPVTALTVFYSLAGLGIAIVNDFKSIEGDRALGLQSLPVAFGIDVAKWITVATIDVTQLAVAAYLYHIGEPTYALVLLGLIAPQVFFQFKYFLPNPVQNDVKYQASAQPFLVFGILATALAVGHHGPLNF